MTKTVPISNGSREENALLRRALGQKLMLDIRYFDSDIASNHAGYNDTDSNTLVGYQASNVSTPRKAVSKLPQDVATLLRQCDIGGVILFSENLVNHSQIQQLTADIQRCAATIDLPMLVSTDQEGGRVARLPRNLWPAFTGNMSIGASLDSHRYASRVGEAIGEQLNNLGINVNHAPTVDVNINPLNPVINVRAFGDDPKKVAKLGICMGEGMLKHNVMPTFKHFPGHGDTNVDSHTGLPLVEHSTETIECVDLYPFKQAIAAQCAPMIMTAHIQYPALDDSYITTISGETLLRPATLSSKILTGLLRTELGYQGVVITDALDMASISHFFTPLEAIIETFRAGADIALMPFKIHNKAGISAFSDLFDQLVSAVEADDVLTKDVLMSFERIKTLKSSLSPRSAIPMSSKKHADLEVSLAVDSLVLLKNDATKLASAQRLLIVCDNGDQSHALRNALRINEVLSTIVIECLSLDQAKDFITPNSLLILAIEDKQSVVTIGGVDDLVKTVANEANDSNILERQLSLLNGYKNQGYGSIFISLKAPYDMAPYIAASNIAVASFDGSTFGDDKNTMQGPAFDALARVIIDRSLASASLPITV